MTDRERFEAWVAEKYFWMANHLKEYMWLAWQEATKQAKVENDE